MTTANALVFQAQMPRCGQVVEAKMQNQRDFQAKQHVVQKRGWGSRVGKCEFPREIASCCGQTPLKRAEKGAKRCQTERILIETQRIRAQKRSKATIADVNPGRMGRSPLRC